MQLVERDDGGPNLWIFKPHTDKIYDFPDGGVVRVTTSDDIGFCNASGLYDAAPSIDLLTLGDSFTWCHAVHMADTWAIRLGESTGLRTYNLGKGGIGPFEYVQILKRFGIPKSPRVVVMNVYEGKEILTWFSGEQRRYFKRVAGELGLIFVDLTPHLQAAITSVDPERLLYYPTTMHYTAEAHALVATVLSEALRKHGLAE